MSCLLQGIYSEKSDSMVTLHGKCTRALTFENVCQRLPANVVPPPALDVSLPLFVCDARAAGQVHGVWDQSNHLLAPGMYPPPLMTCICILLGT